MKTIARCRLVSIPLAALAVCLGFFGADGPARANDDLPRDTKQIETLTPDQARKLVADFNGTLLVLDGLTILDVETAKALASYGGDVLVLGGLTALDSEVARALAGFKGRMLALNGLRTLNAATAGAIATFKGDVIALNGLKAIDDEAAAALAGFEGKMLAMNGLTKRGGKLRRDVSPTRAGGRKPRITISKETTRIEGPVDLDGYVDYVAAYHQRAGRGLSPDTNAAVLMIRAIGSNGIPEDARVDYFDTLGIPPLPEKGPYLVSLDEYFDHIHNKAGEEPNEDDREQLWVSLEQSMTRPWSKREFPVLAQWLEVNDRPLSLVVEATKRPRWYEPPVLDGNQLLIGANFPLVFASREVARALTIRATLRLHSGQIEQAWDDMLACHRLARLMAQGMTLIEALTAVAIETTVCSADQAMLGGAVLTAAQARRMYNDLKKMAPLSSIEKALDSGERFMFLDGVHSFAIRGPREMARVVSGHGGSGNTVDEVFDCVVAKSVNWDSILQRGNTVFDRMVAAARARPWTESKNAMTAISTDLRKLNAKRQDPRSIAVSVAIGGSRHAITYYFGNHLIWTLVPAFTAAVEAERREDAHIEVTKLGYLLAAYRADHAKYPTTLLDLVPEYVKEVPPDPFTGHPFVYRKADGGYLLYSLGANGIDEGGRGYDDDDKKTDEYEGGDDVSLEVSSEKRAASPK